MTGRLKLIAGVCSVGMVLTVVGAAQAHSAPLLHTQHLRWGACAPIHHASQATQCATVMVPRDYARPDGPQISVTVSRIPARDQAHKRGVLFGNPGGPGGDGIGMFSRTVPPDRVRNEWDLVAVQPRGLIDATPVRCDPITDPAQASPAELGRVNRERCEKNTPGYTRTITTETTARDIESVRRALGPAKISLYGISYGTLLMATYATLYPQHTDRLVLDSAVNPDWIWNDILAKQTAGYKARINAMFAWIARHDNTYHLGTTPLKVYRKWSDRVTTEAGVPPSVAAPPARVGDVPPGLKAVARQYLAGTDLTADARARFENLVATLRNPGAAQSSSMLLADTRAAAPDRNLWPIIARLVQRRVTPATPGGETAKALTNGQNMQALMLCNENVAPAQPGQIPAALYATYLVGDVVAGPGLVYQSGIACAGAAPVTRLVPLHNARLRVQPLQIQSKGDPQTPYHGAATMRHRMRSHLITVGGGDHGQLGRKNVPLDNAIGEYLATGHTSSTTAPQAPISTPLVTGSRH